MIMTLYTLAHHESRMHPIDFGIEGHGALMIENGFQTITDSNQPMIMKLHILAPLESRMCPIDISVKSSRSWGIIN